MRDAVASGKIFALERPDPALWKLYVIRAIFTGPLLVVTLPSLYFRFHTGLGDHEEQRSAAPKRRLGPRLTGR